MFAHERRARVSVSISLLLLVAPSVQTHPWGISRVTDRSFVMKYTITKDAEAEIQYEGKEGIAGERPRTVVEVRPSIRPFAVASRRANANATPTMKDDEDYRN